MYCSLHEDLLELVDGFKTDKVGICWDTGHANLQGLDQPDCLKAIGSRLKALHIADNNKLSDEHLAPYFGSIDWDGIMKALSDINYQGVFTFETHKHVHPFPEALRDDCIKLLYNIGNYLVNII